MRVDSRMLWFIDDMWYATIDSWFTHDSFMIGPRLIQNTSSFIYDLFIIESWLNQYSFTIPSWLRHDNLMVQSSSAVILCHSTHLAFEFWSADSHCLNPESLVAPYPSCTCPMTSSWKQSRQKRNHQNMGRSVMCLYNNQPCAGVLNFLSLLFFSDRITESEKKNHLEESTFGHDLNENNGKLKVGPFWA